MKYWFNIYADETRQIWVLDGCNCSEILNRWGEEMRFQLYAVLLNLHLGAEI